VFGLGELVNILNCGLPYGMRVNAYHSRLSNFIYTATPGNFTVPTLILAGASIIHICYSTWGTECPGQATISVDRVVLH
jgi:hypothetical protein